MDHLLEAERLKKTYKGKEAVRDVSVKVGAGEIVGLLGPNGAGKTTTFNMITGLIARDGGQVWLDGEDIGGLPMYLRGRKGLNYLPQEPSIFRKLTVRQNIEAVLEIKGVSGDEKFRRTERLLEEFGLVEFALRRGMRLSGGERRRTEIARALATEPHFMLFDEPFAGIDPITIIELKKMLKYLKNKGLGIVITDHNVRDTLSITDRACIISSGEILYEGTPEELVDNELVRKTYLGEDFRL